MFKNIGGKIKGFAKFMCWLGIIVSVITGIAVILFGVNAGTIVTEMSAYDPTLAAETAAVGGVSTVVMGVMIIVVGSLVSWIGSFMTYGFGELIDNSSKMVAILKKWED